MILSTSVVIFLLGFNLSPVECRLGTSHGSKDAQTATETPSSTAVDVLLRRLKPKDDPICSDLADSKLQKLCRKAVKKGCFDDIAAESDKCGEMATDFVGAGGENPPWIQKPSPAPTGSPTLSPARTISSAPSSAPSFSPSTAPSSSPTSSPTISISPSSGPSSSPSKTTEPSSKPSASPTESVEPSSASSTGPTGSVSPSTGPSASPTGSKSPSSTPSPSPSESEAPSGTPSSSPTQTLEPSSAPSAAPTKSAAPSEEPSATPSKSAAPSSAPSPGPTKSTAPSNEPSAAPTMSAAPSLAPSLQYSSIQLSDASFSDPVQTTSVGVAAPVSNMQPYQALNYIIAVQGTVPSRERRMEERGSYKARQLGGGGDPLLGEIAIFAGDFAPRGWKLCNGQLLSVTDYDELFSLIQTEYGGDGRSTFAVPDLRGRVPQHYDVTRFPFGYQGGVESIMYSQSEMPSHNHYVANAADLTPFDSTLVAASGSNQREVTVNAISTPDPIEIGNTGFGRAMENIQPYLALNFNMAVEGIEPQTDPGEGETQNYLGTLSIFAFNFVPEGFASCDGQQLTVSENQGLFSVLSNTYGGDGRTSFRLPDMRRNVAVHGSRGIQTGQETISLAVENLPSHAHSLTMNNFDGRAISAEEPFLDLVGLQSVSFEGITDAPTASTSTTGIGQPLTNLQPSLGMKYIIALEGFLPSRTRRLDDTTSYVTINKSDDHSRKLSTTNALIGEIAIFAGDVPPSGWVFCEGQLLSIAENSALFSLLGSTYGGDGRKTFGLPNLNGRVAIGAGSGPGLSSYARGETGGSSETVLSVENLPPHSHGVWLEKELTLSLKEKEDIIEI